MRLENRGHLNFSRESERFMQKISVSVPFDNAEGYLQNGIMALFAQSYSPEEYEVILVDNDSTDLYVTKRSDFRFLTRLKEFARWTVLNRTGIRPCDRHGICS